MTSAGVPAIDFNNAADIVDTEGNHLNVSFASHFPGNHAPEFYELLDAIATSGRCSVSSNCYPPSVMVAHGIRALLAKPEIARNLEVYTLAVPVNATRSVLRPGAVDALSFVQRRPAGAAACGGWDRPLSQDIGGHYSPTPSARWSKRVLEFRGAPGAPAPVFVDATEWGELLAILDAPYLQGLSERFDGDTSGAGGSDQCGQSFSVTLTATLHDTPQHETDRFAPMPEPAYTANCNSNTSCDFIWQRRRLLSADPGGGIASGDVTLFVLQDWRWSYLLKSRVDTRAEVAAGWAGGVNVSVLRQAEMEALGWYGWLKTHAWYGPRLTLRDAAASTSSSPVGTCTGLMKMPYVRGARRSIGIDGFVLNASAIRWDGETPLPTRPVGTPFPDRVAITSFFLDVHEMHDEGSRKCYPDYIPSYIPYYNDKTVLPFSIPLRALTNKQYDKNFLVAGKVIATSFLASSATRLHPGEWASGTAAGAVAAMLVRTGNGVSEVLADPSTLARVVAAAANHTPRDWVLQCPWGAGAASRGEGWRCIGPPTPKPPPPGAAGHVCLGPTGQQVCVPVGAVPGAPGLNATCGGACPGLGAADWLASTPLNWEVRRSPAPRLSPPPARNCSGWDVTMGYVLHSNDTGAATPPRKNMSAADLVDFCIGVCCRSPVCYAWVTGPADGKGPTWKVGDQRCYLKNKAAVSSKRWPMANVSYAAFGIAPGSPEPPLGPPPGPPPGPSPPPPAGTAILVALRDTTLKKSELDSRDLPHNETLPVKKGAVWHGVGQLGSQYWLVRAPCTAAVPP